MYPRKAHQLNPLEFYGRMSNARQFLVNVTQIHPINYSEWSHIYQTDEFILIRSDFLNWLMEKPKRYRTFVINSTMDSLNWFSHYARGISNYYKYWNICVELDVLELTFILALVELKETYVQRYGKPLEHPYNRYIEPRDLPYVRTRTTHARMVETEIAS